jgi:hypothetical protein
MEEYPYKRTPYEQRNIDNADAAAKAEQEIRIIEEILPQFPIEIRSGKILTLIKNSDNQWEFLIDGQSINKEKDIQKTSRTGDSNLYYIYGIPANLLLDQVGSFFLEDRVGKILKYSKYFASQIAKEKEYERKEEEERQTRSNAYSRVEQEQQVKRQEIEELRRQHDNDPVFKRLTERLPKPEKGGRRRRKTKRNGKRRHKRNTTSKRRIRIVRFA